MTDVKKPLPVIISHEKFSDVSRRSLGGVVLASAVLVTPFNRVSMVIATVMCILSFQYRDLAVFCLGSLGQVLGDGPRTVVKHAKERSRWLVVDTISVLFGILSIWLLLEQSNLLFTLVTCSMFITIFNRTLKDQAKLSCSDEDLTNLFDSYNQEEDVLFREKEGKAVKLSKKKTSISIQKLAKLPEFSWKQVKEHNTKDDLWVVANDLVYDLTPFYPHHPGGRKVLTTMAGRDATDVLEVYHPSNVFSVLPKYLVGKVANDTVSQSSESVSESGSESFNWRVKNEEINADYRKSRQLLLEMNLFESDLDYYTVKFLFNGVMLSVAVYLNFYANNFALHMLSAVLVGVVWQQMAFVGHDLGHTGVSHKRAVDYSLGAGVGTLLGGISISWWKYSHNVHHINCNSVHDDADIQHMPVFAVHESMLSSFYSRFHRRLFVFDSIAKVLLSYQHFLYYPIMAVARLNLYLQSLIFFLKNPRLIEGNVNYDVEHKFTEFFCLLGFFLWYGCLVANLPTTTTMLASFLLTHAVAGVLHVQICISHFSMHSYAGQFNNQVEAELYKTEGLEKVAMKAEGQREVAESEENWLLLQMRTTMDVKCPRELDFFHGGLQYQVEHHLFPRLPRHNQRIAQVLVEHVCSKYNIEHRNLSFVAANQDLVSHLRVKAYEAREKDVDRRDFSKSDIYEAMNLIG